MIEKYGGPIVSALTLLIGAVLFEFALRWFPVPDPHANLKTPYQANYVVSQFPTGFRFDTYAESGLPGVEGHNVFTANNIGYRGDSLMIPKPAGEFRIFIVGGSTAECLYLDDPQAIGAVLQRELNKRGFPVRKNVKVYNAGKSGDRSDDHVAMITQRILHLEPDLIILFSGVNDLLAAMRGFDYLHMRNPHGNRLKLNLILRMAATELQIPRRIDRLANRFFRGRERQILEEIRATSNYREKAQLAQAAAPTEAEPGRNLSAYRDNLLTIAGAVKNNGAALIFMTQASTWNSSVDPQVEKWQWLLYVDGVRYRADRMDRALESYNDVMREVARKHKTPVYDLALLLPKSLDYIYDDVHFNARGAHWAAVGLAGIIGSNDARRYAH